MGAQALELLFRRYAETQDESAARELVARTRPRLLAIARRIGNTADAEDSVQTAYLSLLHKREDFDAPVLAWLVTATVRIAYRAKAKRQRLTELAEALVRPPAPETPAALAVAADEKRVLRQRVADLPASLRDAAVLHYFHGLSTEETARLLDLSRDAVKKRLQRARTTLRSRWGPRLASLMFAFPWWCADTVVAAAGLAGGLVMKKAAVAVAILIALAATTVGFVWQRGGRQEREQPLRSSLAGHNVSEPEVEEKPVDSEAADPGVVDDDHSGVVVTPDGKPVEGASVRIGAYFWKNGNRGSIFMPVSNAPARTDAAGHFTLQPPKKDEIDAVEYHAHAAGFAWTSERSRLDQKARIVLRRGGTLLVAVRREDGSPVEGAHQIVGRRAESGFEDFLYEHGANGRFDLIPGEYEVRVQATGLAPSRRTIVKISGDSEDRLTVTLMTGMAYAIHVVDPAGQDVEGATVEVNGPGSSTGFAKTDRSGRCRITGIAIPNRVAANPYAPAVFHVKATGFAPFRWSMQMPESEGEEEVRLQLRRGARVVFRFRGVDGKLLRKQRVSVHYVPSEPPSLGHQLASETDGNGEVVCPALEKGRAIVQVEGLEKHAREITLTGEPQEILIDLAPGDHELAGSVFAIDGSPVVLGEVGFVPLAQAKKGPRLVSRTPIARDGSFRIAGLKAGAGSLWVWAPGMEAQHMPVRVPSESVEMRLREGHRVAGIVVTRAGEPVPGVTVRLMRSFGVSTEVGKVTTDANGRFAFRGVGDGPKLRVSVYGKKWINSYGFGHVVTPGDQSVRLTVKPESEGMGLSIPIEVVDERGRPLHGKMRLSYSHAGRSEWRPLPLGATGTPGLFVISYYDAPGTYDLEFSMSGRLRVVKTGVVIADTDKQPTLRIVFDRGAVLAVVVRHPDGTPVANTTLNCGNAVVRTDAHGRAEFGGFRPGIRRVEIYKESDYFLHSGSVEVELPGRVEVVLIRRGVVFGKAGGKGPFHWRLLDADGAVRDEQTTAAAWARLFTTVGGPHRLLVKRGEQSFEYEVTAKLGKSVTVDPK